MNNFNITIDHEIGKIKLIREIQSMVVSTNRNPLSLFASAWSAPGWMKDNGIATNGGQLKGSPGGPYYKTWAKYYSKFFDAYKAEGIEFWGMTTQNEPKSNVRWQSMSWNAETQRDWLKLDLGPLMRQNHPEINIMVLDDQRVYLQNWATTILDDEEAAEFVDGIGKFMSLKC